MCYTRVTHLKKYTKGGKLKAQKNLPNFLVVFIDRPSSKDFNQEKLRQARTLSKLRRKTRAVKLIEQLQQTRGSLKAIGKASNQVGIHPRTLRRWWRQYLDSRSNVSGLQEKSRRPHRIHYQIHPLIEYFVLIVRIYLGWGAGRIEAEFRARDISNISHQTTHDINHLRSRVNNPETNGKYREILEDPGRGTPN